MVCPTEDDQNNVPASLVGNALGFTRVVTRIGSMEDEQICAEQGLSDAIIPDRTIARTLADMVEGRNAIEMSTFVEGDARFFSLSRASARSGFGGGA